MKNLRLFVFSSAAITLLAGMGVGACSSSDTDATTPDSGSDSPSGSETSTGNETGTNEGGTTDAPADTGPDHNIDAGLTLETFADTVANAMCDSLARCCYGSKMPADGGLDGGASFDRGQCMKTFGKLGFESSLYHVGLLPDGGLATGGAVSLDQYEGDMCLKKIEALSCNMSAAELKDIRSACFGALKGTLAAGASCYASLECASGNYCKPVQKDKPLDGTNKGTCTALAGQNGNCSIQETAESGDDAANAEVACSNKASGDTNLHCEFFSPNDPAPDNNGLKADRSQWKCVPNVANGQACIGTPWCANGLCDPSSLKCTDPLTYFSSNVCQGYVVP